MSFLNGMMGTLGEKILESLKILTKRLSRQLLKLIDLVAESGRLVPRKKFIKEEGNKPFPS